MKDTREGSTRTVDLTRRSVTSRAPAVARLRGVENLEHVSVFYPRGTRTGGPEALHQLVHSLRSLGHDAALVPLSGTENVPRVAAYGHYDAPEISRPRTGPRDAVVIPETWVPRDAVLGGAQRVCWWLSVDNSPVFIDQRRREQRLLGEPLAPPTLRSRVRGPVRRLLVPVRVRRIAGAVHVAQSAYAQDMVARRLGEPVGILSDYVVLDTAERAASGGRTASDRPTVSFNPAKGGELVARVQALIDQPVVWLPIVDMTPVEVRAALRRSDVYLDLGHLPGKDRLPREAALSGAVTLVAARGAGANARDFPLPDQHRIPAGPDLVAAAADTLSRVLQDLPSEFAAQAGFRAGLASEKAVFDDEVRSVFGEPASGPR